MKLQSHIIISFSVSAFLYFIFRSYILSLSSFIVGIFIDLDHFFEYFYHCGFELNVKKFFKLAEEYAYKKTFLLLHSWELFLIFSALIFFSSANEILFGVYVAYTIHLLFDQFGNLSKPLSYSFIYRWKNKFSAEKLWRTDLLGCK
ncbi:MAG: hypothetical protein A2474_07200 [Elusimicrobia bacterium RIFOXYC2_FULL_34_12]|nr:MAG: hypothetical protein A2474_07200 [Elusimicrobia bacterium RIFOXYC2_FULL_34_12]OGS39456.1 MAG: hypothetical protein A2551_01210 [Elusimicrobia bacterium RIFOXYD2_FULL_34_30]HAM39426.1 hypothetical protein [Elusimicrobiota bacterium]